MAGRPDDHSYEVNLFEQQRRDEHARSERKVAADRANVLTQVRSEILNQAGKGFALINGGGAVAMGGLLQAVWARDDALTLKFSLVYAIGLMAVGVVIASVQPVLRYFTSHDPDSKTVGRSGWWRAYMLSVGLSALCFLVASGLVVRGGWLSLSGQ